MNCIRKNSAVMAETRLEALCRLLAASALTISERSHRDALEIFSKQEMDALAKNCPKFVLDMLKIS